MNDRLLTLLGFAAKSGNLSFGSSAVDTAVKRKKAKLVLICFDISPKSQKEIKFICDKYNVKTLILENHGIDTVTAAVGRKCGIISVNDEKFAKAVSDTLIGGNANDK